MVLLPVLSVMVMWISGGRGCWADLVSTKGNKGVRTVFKLVPREWHFASILDERLIMAWFGDLTECNYFGNELSPFFVPSVA